ncbi:MAG: DUF1707 domain-containing protein, partial [Solirubrobacterales bacterium]|nr:DUF1707 domain-containing protein [Solirubrobacterales bacterium]
MVPAGRFLAPKLQRRGATRASDHDRDDTLKQLSEAAIDGRITLQEY